jgi:hypothetical protein
MGVEMDETEAVELHLRLQRGCDSYAMYTLGCVHENGKGMENDMAPNYIGELLTLASKVPLLIFDMMADRALLRIR